MLALALVTAPVVTPATARAVDVPETRCDIAVTGDGGSVQTRTVTADLSTARTSAGAVIAPVANDDTWDVVTSTSTFDAISIVPHSAWIPGSGANWVNARNTYASGGGGGVVVIDQDVSLGGDTAIALDTDPGPITVGTSTTRFRARFTLPPRSFLSRLDLQYAADNGVTFFLNGVAIGGYDPPTANATAFNQMHTLAYTGALLRSGSNVLDAVVTDYGVATGLLVRGGYGGCAVTDVEAGTCVSVLRDGVTTWRARRIGLNTGSANNATPDAIGATDQKWTTVSPSAGPAYSVAPYPGWYDDSTVANWIHRTADPRTGGGIEGDYDELIASLGSGTRSSGAVAGLPDVIGTTTASPTTYRYRVQFNVPSGVTYRDLDLQYAADNGVAFFLNGVPIGGISGGTTNHTPFNQLHPLLWNGAGFVSGVNTLDAVVTDFGVASGLIVEGAARVCDPAAVSVEDDLPIG